MTSSGVLKRNWMGVALNLYKGNTLVWRKRAEDEIRASGIDYTIVRTVMLVNAPGNRRAVRATQAALPLSLRSRIARADVADAFVAALDHPKMSRATIEIVWARGRREKPWQPLFDTVAPDPVTAEHGPGTNAFG